MSASQELAEAYVLGRLEPEARAEVEARIAAPADAEDAALAAEVRALSADWHDVDLTAPPAPMSPGAWESLQAELSAERGRAAPAAARPAPPMRAGARAVPRPAARTGRGWKILAGATTAASLALAAVLALDLFTPQPAVMAILLDDDGGSVALIEAFDDDSLRVTPLEDFSPEGAQVLQIWTKPDADGPPVSLGVLGRAMRAIVDGPDLPRPATGQLYEITIEPPGGSPTGLPTGPIVGKGLAQRPL
ncbi:anti-sigma factor [Albimonas sp. CAU 1670]|uniref:anti-sigma factor n=1 Tax=Albimonas sp. CAU 1670 TaxID=3032599 RepID=UPI0023DCA564|nr:anti-sigma factor [Albimonas sp. CAU 1670]MDF2233799.1 anti-sigma factor [Albimonas sp. CAU 1670]